MTSSPLTSQISHTCPILLEFWPEINLSSGAQRGQTFLCDWFSDENAIHRMTPFGASYGMENGEWRMENLGTMNDER